MNGDLITCKCIEVQQPIGSFYVAAMSSRDLIKISHVDQRLIERETDGFESVLGIQRELSPNRVKELHQYVNTVDATFPTGIIIAISEKASGSGNSSDSSEDQLNVQFDGSSNELRIRNEDNIATVLDGQHRIAGLEDYEGSDFQLNVVIFVDMDISDQATVFATINKAQTKVNKSLVYDLYDYANSRSPQKTCHDIARLLNRRENSPFRDKIKILGKAHDKEQETITQATFVESLMRYITNNAIRDRDDLKRGRQLGKAIGKDAERRFLRERFLQNKDAEIARIVWDYFSAVDSKWTDRWNTVKTGNILNKSTGFLGLMKFFRDAYLSSDEKSIAALREHFGTLFDKINIPPENFTPDVYKPGATGQNHLYNDLLRESGIEKQV